MKKIFKLAIPVLVTAFVLTGCSVSSTSGKGDSVAAPLADAAFPVALEAATAKQVVSPESWASSEVCGKVIPSFDDLYEHTKQVIDLRGWLGRSMPPLQETFIPTLWVASEPDELSSQGTTMLRARVEASMQNLLLFTESTPTTVPCSGSEDD